MKTVTKRLLCLLTVVVMLGCCAVSVSAQHIPQLSLSVEFPESYTVITRDMVELGYDTDIQSNKELKRYWETANIYASAYSETYTDEIVVTMLDSPLRDFAEMDDDALELIADDLIDAMEDYGAVTQNHFITEKNNTPYIVYEYKNPIVKSTCSLQYHTVRGGKAYNFAYHSYDGEISFSDVYHIAKMVSSVRFDDNPAQTTTTTTAPSEEDGTDGNMWLYLGIGMGIGLIVVLVTTAVVKVTTQTGEPQKKWYVRFCRYCGKELPEESAFCPFCGKTLGE